MQKIDIKIGVSKQLFCCVLVLFAISFLIVLSLPLMLLQKMALILLLLGYGLYFIFPEVLLKKATSITSMTIDGSSWVIYDLSQGVSVELCGTSTVTAFVSVLRFKIPGQKKRRSCVILRDSLPANQYRSLLLRARN